jgi:hypothetical protein
MGFHKRRITIEHVLGKYETDGLTGVKQLFKADALILENEWVSDVHRMLIDGDNLKIINMIKIKIIDKDIK